MARPVAERGERREEPAGEVEQDGERRLALAMPEWSGSTPIVWNDHVFLNVAEGNDMFLWAIDRNKGTVRWKGC